MRRVYAKIRAKQLQNWVSTWASDANRGGMRGTCVQDTTVSMTLRLEDAAVDNKSISGAVADVRKCFNRLPRHALFALIRMLLQNTHWVKSWEVMVNHTDRVFGAVGCESEPMVINTGVAEGCPLSCAMMCLTNERLARCIVSRIPRHEQGKVELYLYADNWQLEGRHGKRNC